MTAVYRVDVSGPQSFLMIIARSPFRARMCAKRAGFTVIAVSKAQD